MTYFELQVPLHWVPSVHLYQAAAIFIEQGGTLSLCALPSYNFELGLENIYLEEMDLDMDDWLEMKDTESDYLSDR
jgi:hypothetical protein